jgi:hypothetical protein
MPNSKGAVLLSKIERTNLQKTINTIAAMPVKLTGIAYYYTI